MEVLLSLVTVALDQMTKLYIIKHLSPGASLPVVEGLFYLTYVENRGSAFGLFPDHTKALILITLLIIVFFVIYLRDFTRKSNLVRVGLPLGIGGAIGNLIDRVRMGYVVDFLDMRILPIFNLADIAIVTGALLIFIGAALYEWERGVEEEE